MSTRIVPALLLAAGLASAAPAPADPAVARLIEQGHYLRARTALTATLAGTPDDATALQQMARVQMAFGDLDAALPLAERAVKLAPRDAAAHTTLAEVCGRKAQKSGPLSQIGLARRFKSEADAALALDPHQLDAQLDLISFHLQAPGIVGGDKAKAKTLVDDLVAHDPANAWRARERFAEERDDTLALGPIYRDAATQQPGDYRARIAYAGWLAAPWRGPAAEAESQARAALALDPGRIPAYTLLAALETRGRRWDELEHTLAEAEGKVPDDLSPWYQAGRICLVEQKDATRAEHYFRHYLSRPCEGGGVPEAAAHWRLGLALEQLGRAAEARAEVETATRLDPRFEPAKKDLKRLKG